MVNVRDRIVDRLGAERTHRGIRCSCARKQQCFICQGCAERHERLIVNPSRDGNHPCGPPRLCVLESMASTNHTAQSRPQESSASPSNNPPKSAKDIPTKPRLDRLTPFPPTLEHRYLSRRPFRLYESSIWAFSPRIPPPSFS